jgi:tetratricopeptide (TPR) repeat protein
METFSQAAIKYFENGQINQAVQCWNQAISSGDDLFANLFNRSQAYILLEQYGSALQDVNTIIALQGATVEPDVLLVQGIALSNLNKFSEALESFLKVEKRQPSALVYTNRAVVYQRQGHLHKALRELIEAVKLSPTVLNRLNLANLHIELGEFAIAAEAMTAVLAEGNSFFPAYLSRGVAYYRLERYDEAVQDLLKMLSFKPDQAAAHYYAGLSLSKLHRPQEAVEHLNQAADLYLQQNQPDLYGQLMDLLENDKSLCAWGF